MFINSEDEGYVQQIHRLQYFWYEFELGKAFLRNEQWGKGFRQFKFIQENYETIINDQVRGCGILIVYDFQYDYHSYCHRKHTLSSLIELIDLEDKLYSQEMYLKSTAYMVNSLVLFNDIKDTIVSPTTLFPLTHSFKIPDKWAFEE